MKIFFLWIVLTAALACAQAPDERMEEVFVNQIGYYPHQVKKAVVKGAGEDFYLISTTSGKIVYSAPLGEWRFWKYSGDSVRIADFSDFSEPGEYELLVGGRRSPAFEISSSLYGDLTAAALKAFYYMRASTPLPREYAGLWARRGGHPDTTVYIHPSAGDRKRPAGGIISSPGGWYDAGDYNKYVVNGCVAAFTLLTLYETFPAATLDLDVNIPESGDGIPDLLNEVLWELQWLRSMQDPNDGGVYHKLTNKNFSAFKLPSELKADRYVVQKTTAAALDLAALFAAASRIYANYEKKLPGLADSLLAQAQAAWQWARKNPFVFYKNPPDIHTGEYNTTGLEDEWLWASVELFIATGDKDYLYDRDLYAYEFCIPTWNWVSSFAYMSILNNRVRLASDFDMARILDKLKDMSDVLVQRQHASAFQVTIDDFKWGSNSHVLNQALTALLAFHFLGDECALEAALADMDYILGKNPLARCYVTGFGKNPPMHPHFRLAAADGVPQPIPGFVVGGPQPYNVEDCGETTYASLLPARCYLDARCSYSTNEVAINWNAPLVFVAAVIDFKSSDAVER